MATVDCSLRSLSSACNTAGYNDAFPLPPHAISRLRAFSHFPFFQEMNGICNEIRPRECFYPVREVQSASESEFVF